MTKTEASQIVLAKLAEVQELGFSYGEAARIVADDYGLDEQALLELGREYRRDTQRIQEGS